MKYSEIDDLKKHYQNIINEAVREIARLQSEIQESEAAIKAEDAKAREAAKAADNEAYKAARLSADMHRERIDMHKVRIIDLKNKHLIEPEAFAKFDRELIHLQNEISNEYAHKLMVQIEGMQKVADEYEKKIGVLNRLGSFVQEQVYRKINPSDGRPDYRLTYKLHDIHTAAYIFEGRNLPNSLDMGSVRRAAARYVKAEALRKIAGDNQKLLAKADRELGGSDKAEPVNNPEE